MDGLIVVVVVVVVSEAIFPEFFKRNAFLHRAILNRRFLRHAAEDIFVGRTGFGTAFHVLLCAEARHLVEAAGCIGIAPLGGSVETENATAVRGAILDGIVLKQAALGRRAILDRRFPQRAADGWVFGVIGFGTGLHVRLCVVHRVIFEAGLCIVTAILLDPAERHPALEAEVTSIGGTGKRGRSGRGGTGGGAPCEERGECQEEDQGDGGPSERRFLLLRLRGGVGCREIGEHGRAFEGGLVRLLWLACYMAPLLFSLLFLLMLFSTAGILWDRLLWFSALFLGVVSQRCAVVWLCDTS